MTPTSRRQTQPRTSPASALPSFQTDKAVVGGPTSLWRGDGLEGPETRTRGWRRGGLHWSPRCRCVWACLSLLSPTCHDDEAKVRRGAHGAECRRQKESTQEGDRTLGACRGRSCSFSTIMGVASSWLPQRVHLRAVSPQERARSVRGSHGARHFQHSSVKGAAPHFGWLGALGGVGEVGERASHHVGGSTVG